jgi:predicted RecB family nuclease
MHEAEEENSYARWTETQDELYRGKQIQRFASEFSHESILHGASDFGRLREPMWRVALNLIARTQKLEANIHAVERPLSKDSDTTVPLIPIRFVWRNKLTRIDRLLSAFDAHVLSQNLNCPIPSGKIVHGDDQIVRKIKTSKSEREVRRIAGKITALLSDAAPPKLFLNRHCLECQFRGRCHKAAVEKDSLSLLGGLSDKEAEKLNSKGIFSVTQLSYTFRARRRTKRHAAKPEKYHHALRALAIRENKIHIVGDPKLKIEGTPLFVDVEGVPDRDFYYLIGVRLKTADGIVQHSLWADSKAEEKRIWADFLNLLSAIAAPILIHYGSFETTFLKKMCNRYGGPPEDSAVAKAVKSSVNLLSVIFARIYFPTYSNGLKEIAKYLGFAWNESLSSGLQSLVWRHQWEWSAAPALQEKLIRYNADDCEALNLLAEIIRTYGDNNFNSSNAQGSELEFVHAESLGKILNNKWKQFKSPIAGLEQINNAAHWNYQRDRVYARAGIVKPKPKRQTQPYRVMESAETTVTWKAPPFCPKCKKKKRTKDSAFHRTVQDIVFGRNSLKRRVVRHVFQTYRCWSCKYLYGLDERFARAHYKYGWNLLAYFIFNIVGLYIPQLTVHHGFKRLFGLDLSRSTMNNLKIRAADYYSVTKRRILDRILQGNLVHADETRANIKGQLAYVWVLTNLREVVYILAESREGELVQKLLSNFKGVLVSDFYAAYDSIACPQQKCLIHLMRDLNDDVLKNPFDEELKKIVTGFSGLLQPIVATIDRYGLKKYFLRKHVKEVERFYKYLDRLSFRSEAACKYKQRFEKNHDKLFTFLLHDGVPWNNNNAEYAIKAFARLRDVISGLSTKKGIEEYLVLLSIFKTCEYQGLDFLDFLRSGEKDIPAFVNGSRLLGG